MTPIYQSPIIEHARAAIGAGRLADPQASITIDNPLCGDRVTVEVCMRDGAVTGFAHEVRGCVLCEAAASVLGSHAIGLTPPELHAVAEAFDRMIRNGGPVPDGWPDLSAFQPVHEARSRHECVLLPFDALGRALAKAAA